MGSVYHGKQIAAWFATVAFTNLVSWTASLNADTADSTAAHATNTGRTRELGFKGGTATVTCKTGGDTQVAIGASGTLELSRDGTNASKGYVGTAKCTGYSPGADKNGVETITYNFVFSGEITGTVTEGT